MGAGRRRRQGYPRKAPALVEKGASMTDVLPAGRVEMLDLEAKYTAGHGEFFFTGIQALVRVPLDQMRADRRNGLRTAGFISGYQGSPLGGFDRELIDRRALLERHGIVHRPGLNEELGATAVMGSQLSSTFEEATYDGVVGIWYGKAPGLDRAGRRHPPRQLRRDLPRRRRAGPGRRRPGLQVLHAAVGLGVHAARPGPAGDLPRQRAGDPRLRPARHRAVPGQRPVGRGQDRDSGGRRGRHRRGPPRADPPGHPRPSSSEAGPTCRPCPATSLPPHSTDVEAEIYEARLLLARRYAELNPGLNADHRRPARRRRVARHRGVGPHLLRGRRGAAQARPRRGRPAAQRCAPAAPGPRLAARADDRRALRPRPGRDRRRRGEAALRRGVAEGPPLRPDRRPAGASASATATAGVLVPSFGALDADALVGAARRPSRPPHRRRPPGAPRPVRPAVRAGLRAVPQAGRPAARPQPVLLLRLPPQHQHQGAGGSAGRRRASAATAWC